MPLKTIGHHERFVMRLMLVPVCCVIAAFLFSAGCLNLSGVPRASTMTTVPTSEPTPLPAQAPVSLPALPVTITSPYKTIPSPYTTPAYPRPVTTYPQQPYRTSDHTASPLTGPEPSDPAAITFRHYSDQNFAVEYPTAWKVTTTGYVRFESGSGRVIFSAEVNDFLPGFEGNFRLNPDITAVQDLVSREFPAYNAKNIIYGYQNTVVNGVPATVYSIRLPQGPVAYQRYMVVTLHHAYRFTFTSDPATFDTTAPLRDYMFSTLTLHDQT
jgi:hypothetical protein